MLNLLIRLINISCVVFIASACAPQDDSANPTEDPVGEIVNITGDLYEARSSFHNNVFLVTDEGIILVDPIGEDFSQWLKVELAERFGTVVKYVIYSHHHPDHVAGGTAFTDTATFVGHEGVRTALNAPLPSNAATLDQNGDGRLDRSEATALGYGGANFDRYDRNGDDSITGVEINAETPLMEHLDATGVTIRTGNVRRLREH